MIVVEDNITQFNFPSEIAIAFTLSLQSVLDDGLRCRVFFEVLHPFLARQHAKEK